MIPRCGRSLVFCMAAQGTVSGMDSKTERPALRIRIVFGGADMIGPGKGRTAGTDRPLRAPSPRPGREMNMSYKRAWELVGTLNAMFREPLVDSTARRARRVAARS